MSDFEICIVLGLIIVPITASWNSKCQKKCFQGPNDGPNSTKAAFTLGQITGASIANT